MKIAPMILLLLATIPVAAEAPEFYVSDQTRELGLPFSDAVRVGDLLILSGQLGNIAGTMQLAPGGLEGETRQTFDHIGNILRAHGASFDDVVKCTILLTDISDWPAFNKIYVEYFPGNKPARSAFATAGLAIGARVEVECLAHVSE